MPIRSLPETFKGPGLTITAVMLAWAGLTGSAPDALALSDTPSGQALVGQNGEGSMERTPLPDPSAADPSGGWPGGEAMRHDPDGPVPEVLYDFDLLPEPVARMRRLIIEACRSGDLERLRPLIGEGPNATQLTLGPLEGDPIDFLRESSGDEDGQEILAILLEVMEAGFVHLNPGTERELYVWPYFFAVPLEELTASQRVELFKLVTAGDYEEMKSFGAYIFYRTAITPEGRWVYFVAGD